MKRLDELGVSPAPWACDPVRPAAVYDNDGGCVADCDLNFDQEGDIANARLVAVAPCLYEALREAVIEYCHPCDDWHRNGDRCSQADGSCFVQRWRKAIAKAGGEE